MPSERDSLPRQADSPHDYRHLMRMRKALGPMCEHCAVWADEWESEYRIDHNASSDMLRAAEAQPGMCRAGCHPRRWPRYPGWERNGWDSRVRLTRAVAGRV